MRVHDCLVAGNNGWNSRLHSSKISKQQQQLSPVNSVHGLLPPVQACQCHAEAHHSCMCACRLQHFLLVITGVLEAKRMYACLPEATCSLRRPPNEVAGWLPLEPGSRGDLLAMGNVESAAAVVVSPLAIPGHLLSSSMQHSQLHPSLPIAMLLRGSDASNVQRH